MTHKPANTVANYSQVENREPSNTISDFTQAENREELAEVIRLHIDGLMNTVEYFTTDETYKMVVKDILDVNNILTDLIIKLKTS